MDIQEEYNMQMERKKCDMNKRNMIVNISGGQVNIAKDNATINAIQNNGMDGNEFETIIQGIKDNLSGLKKEDGDEILDVLEQVKEEYREVLYLLYFEEMKYEEAGRVMGKSVPQITNLAHRAKKSIKKILEKEGFTYAHQ